MYSADQSTRVGGLGNKGLTSVFACGLVFIIKKVLLFWCAFLVSVYLRFGLKLGHVGGASLG